MTVGIGTTEVTIELGNSIIATASNIANSSLLTWEDTNKSSWVDYVSANSSDGKLNSTATYQSENEWLTAHKNVYDDSYLVEYDIAWKEAVGDS